MKNLKKLAGCGLLFIVATTQGCALAPVADENTPSTESDELRRDCNNRRRDVNSRASETCNGIDDNCNGTVDEGELCPVDFVCRGAQLCQPIPVEVRCNGIDDDLDGQVDEGFGLGQACTAGVGACQSNGVQVCGANQQVVCNAVPGNPALEVCDAVDNDCDGIADEDLGLGEACSAGVGACERDGILQCGDNGAVECSAQPGAPVGETCNGLDDNCDAIIDNGGDVLCANGQSCEGVNGCEAIPSEEICDGVDNDLNGQVDEGFGLGQACTVGIGACERSGVLICTDDHTASTCSVEPGQPANEVPGNGIDENCDGADAPLGPVACVNDGDCRIACNPAVPNACINGFECRNFVSFNFDDTVFEDFNTCVPAALPADYLPGCSFEAPFECTFGYDPEHDGEVEEVENTAPNGCMNGIDDDADNLIDALDLLDCPAAPPPECVNNADCAADQSCLNGSCELNAGACRLNADCAANQVCQDRLCVGAPVPPPAPRACVNDAGCAADEVCIADHCMEQHAGCGTFAISTFTEANQRISTEWYDAGVGNLSRREQLVDGLFPSEQNECSVLNLGGGFVICHVRNNVSYPSAPTNGIPGCTHNGDNLPQGCFQDAQCAGGETCQDWSDFGFGLGRFCLPADASPAR